MSFKNLFAARGRALPSPARPGAPVAEVCGLRVRLGQRDVLSGIDLVARAGPVQGEQRGHRVDGLGEVAMLAVQGLGREVGVHGLFVPREG